MPQLNPTPWFLTLLTTWLAIKVMLALINSTKLINNPTTNINPMNKKTYIWPW
uniref:ATP synthase complex subunit 8 n=1 Tax=Trioceros melleri TaxID=179915 RepID=D6RS01_TRIMD|nr:ATP synthase F0 subunit 8 [Trioceros melleri]BAJ08090.1 ATPase subunit 8 [Trioceros melleri]